MHVPITSATTMGSAVCAPPLPAAHQQPLFAGGDTLASGPLSGGAASRAPASLPEPASGGLPPSAVGGVAAQKSSVHWPEAARLRQSSWQIAFTQALIAAIWS